MPLLRSEYLMSHASSTILDARSAQAEGTAQISIQPVAGSIKVNVCKKTALPVFGSHLIFPTSAFRHELILYY